MRLANKTWFEFERTRRTTKMWKWLCESWEERNRTNDISQEKWVKTERLWYLYMMLSSLQQLTLEQLADGMIEAGLYHRSQRWHAKQQIKKYTIGFGFSFEGAAK